MLLKSNQKLFLYEVQPLFFKDSSQDGFGDFVGFLSKIEYFKYLQVDGVIFPDLFNQEKILLKPNEVSTFNKYGKLAELKQIIEWFKTNEIDFFVEINLEEILNSNINKNPENKSTVEILIKETNNDNEMSWSSAKTINSLNNILNFWTKQNVNNFVLVNFEHLYNKDNNLDNLLIEQLKYVYKIIKQVNEKNTISLKSHLFDTNVINDIFNKDKIGSICDLFIDNSYSFISTNSNQPKDILEKFNPKNLLNKIKSVNIPKDNFWRYVVSFDSNLIGRISSRWTNENALFEESIKTFLIILHLMPYSSINYYGSEIGTLRTKIKNINDYYDFSYNERKRKLESNNYSEKKFHKSQAFLSPIHSQSIFIWDDSENGGFSNANKMIRNLPIKYQKINVKNQYNNQHSNLNFYKKIIDFVNNSYFINHFNFDIDFKIKKNLKNDLFTYQLIHDNSILKILINPTNKNLKYEINNKNVILFSSYTYKQTYYQKKIKYLNPYESVVYISKKVFNEKINK